MGSIFRESDFVRVVSSWTRLPGGSLVQGLISFLPASYLQGEGAARVIVSWPEKCDHDRTDIPMLC